MKNLLVLVLILSANTSMARVCGGPKVNASEKSVFSQVYESVKDSITKKEDFLTWTKEKKLVPLNLKEEFEAWAEKEQNETILNSFMDVTNSNSPELLLNHFFYVKRAAAGFQKSPAIENTITNYFKGYFDDMTVNAKLIETTDKNYKIALTFTFVPGFGNTEYITFEINVTEEGYEIVGEKRSVDGTLNC